MQSFGQYIVNDLLPKELRSDEVLDGKALKKKLYTFARSNPGEAAKQMDKLRELGHSITTTEGVTIGLDDITPNYKARDAVVKPALAKLKKTSDPAKRQKIILDAQNKMIAATKNFHGSQGLLMRSGGRGSPVQLMRMSMSPVASRTSTGDTYPWLVKHSYAEGLRPSEMFPTNVETRNNQIASFKQVTEPGEFSKVLVENMNDQMILEEDCGTKNGILLGTDDSNIVDRYLAQPYAGFRAGTLVTPQVFSRIHKKKGKVMVRSPMTCELNDGICQRCYGLDEKGNHHMLGTNVGVRSAQAITEPLTQFQLSAKHGVLQAGLDKSKVEGLAGLRNFLEIPKSFTNRAILSAEDGKVTRIERAPQGGHDIYVGDNKYYTPPHLDPSVRKGDAVTPGDALSDGIPMPNEIVQYKGMGAGRKYMVDRLQDVYSNQGVNVDRRHLEILAKSHMNHVQIDEDPEDRFYPGEVVNYTTLLKSLGDDVKSVPIKSAVGKVMGRSHLHHTAGTSVTPEIARELSKSGMKTITIAKTPPRVSFIMRPITRNPLLNPDWLARMGHRNLKDSVLEGAHFGQRSEIHGTHPIPAYVYGAAFGTGKGKRY